MYCPNCEFEIKQEVTECPICGGELTEYSPDASTGDNSSEGEDTDIKKPLDTCISDLILDAKHELDSLDSTSDSDAQPVEPLSSSLDFESILSEDSTENEQPSAEFFTAEPTIPAPLSNAPEADNETFSLDDTASLFSETDATPVNESPFVQSDQPQNLFPDDKLFMDEAAAPADIPGADNETFSLDDTASLFSETDAPAVTESPFGQSDQPQNLFPDDKLFMDEAAAPADIPGADNETFSLDDTASLFSETDAPAVTESPFGQSDQPENLFSDDKLFMDEAAAPADIPGADNETFSLDDTASPFPETEAPPVTESPFGQSDQPENLFSDDKLFMDEAAVPAKTTSAGPAIEELSAEQPASLTNSEMIPPQEQAPEEPWSLQELSERETTNFIPETQTEKPGAAPANGSDFLAAEETESAETTGEQGSGKAGSGSKKRLVFIILFGVLLIAGAYAFSEFFPQFIEPDQAKEHIQPRMIPRTAVKKTRTPAQPVPQAPAGNIQEITESADTPPDTTQQQISAPQTKIQTPTADLPSEKTPQPEASTPEPVSAETVTEKTGQDQASEPEKKPERTTDKALKSSPKTASTPEKKESPARANYTIHVASFKAPHIAQKEVEQLLGLGFDAYIETVDLGEKGIWHRVKVGHYATRADAEQTVESIRQQKTGISPLIYKNK